MSRSYKTKVRAPQSRLVRHTGDEMADLAIHQYEAKLKLAKTRRKDRKWKLAAAAADNPRLLIGNPKSWD